MTIADPIPDEAVEAAYGAFLDSFCDDEAGRVELVMAADGSAGHVMTGGNDARAVFAKALTAAAPLIATQATADLRAGIEALRDEWRMHEAANLRAASTQPENSSGLLLHTAIAGLCKAHADALDALLREGE